MQFPRGRRMPPALRAAVGASRARMRYENENCSWLPAPAEIPTEFQHAIGARPMIKTILVPTGGSDTDFVVFETALALAQLFIAHLEFFHVRVDAAEALRYLPHATFARGRGLRNALDERDQESQARSRAGKQHFQNFCRRHRLNVHDT